MSEQVDGSRVVQVSVISLPILQFVEPKEIPIPVGARGLGAEVDGLTVRVHIEHPENAPVIPHRIGFAAPTSVLAGARHLATAFGHKQVWHVYVEDVE